MMLDGQEARPEETLFIDDSQKNVETAASLGIHMSVPKNGQDWTRPQKLSVYKKDPILLLIRTANGCIRRSGHRCLA